MPPLRRLVTLALLLAAATAGCADDRPPERARAGHVAVVLDDFSIAPQRIRARPGPLTFDVVNRGRIAHNLVVRRGEAQLAPRLATLRPGASGSVTVRLRRGEYTLVCSLANHEELGQSGILVVR